MTLTYPHIGNVGANAEDVESRGVFAASLIIRDLPLTHSSFRAAESAGDYLTRTPGQWPSPISTPQSSPASCVKAVQPRAGCIMAGEIDKPARSSWRGFGSMAGQTTARVVSCDAAYPWQPGRMAAPGAVALTR